MFLDNSPALNLDDLCSLVENRGMTKTKVDCTKKVRDESAKLWGREKKSKFEVPHRFCGSLFFIHKKTTVFSRCVDSNWLSSAETAQTQRSLLHDLLPLFSTRAPSP